MYEIFFRASRGPDSLSGIRCTSYTIHGNVIEFVTERHPDERNFEPLSSVRQIKVIN
jgi:hypothetical protein